MLVESPSQYDYAVTEYVKVSVTLEAEVLERAREIAGPRGLSAYVNEAVRRENEQRGLREILDELIEKHGPPDEAEIRRLDEEWR